MTFGVSPDELHEYVMDAGQGSDNFRRNGGLQQLSRQLRVDLRLGRTDSKDVEAARIEAFGRNELPPPPEVTFAELLMEPLGDTMMLLLMAAAVISLVLGFTVADPTTQMVDYTTCWIEGTAILASVAIVTFVTAINNYQKEKKFKELSDSGPAALVNVLRNGKTLEIPATQLLVGDLVFVVGGMVVPVDGVVVKSSGIKMDESAATGENLEIEKTTEGDCIVRSGSNVVEGEGLVLVTGVGINSFSGRITMEIRQKKADTPLQEQLSDLADNIGYMGMGAAALMFLVLSAKELYEVYVLEDHPLVYKKFLDTITTSITIVVVAVPEGLPLSVTIALAYSMKQMFKENNLVRHLAACETMGGATTICTDKTGTLTQNLMTVVQGYFGNRLTILPGDPAQDGREITKALNGSGSKELASLLAESLSVNSSAAKKRIPGDKPGVHRLEYVGNKTEQSMLKFLEKGGFDPMAVRAGFNPTDVHVFPFTSAKKTMTTCIRLNGVMRYHVKGGAEMIVDRCVAVHCGSHSEPITEGRKAELLSTINEMAKNRLRTIAVAYAESRIPSQSTPFPSDDITPPLCLLGIIGIEDPIRPEVPASVDRCRKAGVSVRMVTGDHKPTAIAIAKKAGIYGKVYSGPAKGEDGLAMEGPVFRELAKSEVMLNRILPRLQVLARASPTDKRILVSALMARGEVVAVTGDGTNDAPALKNANVGFAMNSGTDVAKNASDVVILDDNFRSIVTAMKWGRNVNDNISKFIQFQTTVNVAAVTIAFVGAIFSGNSESPLKPVQLLWLNLIMDTMAALALATETPSEDVLTRPPRGRQAPLISRRMWVNIIGQSIYQIALQLWLLHRGYEFFGFEHESIEHLTVVFNIFVLLQVVNEFNARILGGGVINVFTGLSHAPMFLAVIVVTSVVQYVGVTFGGAFMHTVPIDLETWKKCIAFSLAPLAIGIVLRMIPVSEVSTELTVCRRRDENMEPIEETEEEEAMIAQRPKMTFQRAAYCVIAQLKVVGALSEAQAEAEARRDNGF